MALVWVGGWTAALLGGCSRATETGADVGPCTVLEEEVELDESTPIGAAREILAPYTGTFDAPATWTETGEEASATLEVELDADPPLRLRQRVLGDEAVADDAECEGGSVWAPLQVALRIDSWGVDEAWTFDDWAATPVRSLASSKKVSPSVLDGRLAEREEYEVVRFFVSLIPCETCASGMRLRGQIDGVPPGAEDGPREPCMDDFETGESCPDRAEEQLVSIDSAPDATEVPSGSEDAGVDASTPDAAAPDGGL